MASAKRDIRTIIDSFSDDLILIAQDIAREQVERAVIEWQAKNEKLLAKQSIQNEKAQRLDEKARRNQLALERIERVAEKRRAREEKKAAERALRLEQRLIADSTAAEKKPGRGRKSSGLLADGAAKKEPTPPPLFVHKRRRDGEIQQLKRGDEEAAPTASATATTNGGESHSAPRPSSAPSPVVPEQLRLGL